MVQSVTQYSTDSLCMDVSEMEDFSAERPLCKSRPANDVTPERARIFRIAYGYSVVRTMQVVANRYCVHPVPRTIQITEYGRMFSRVHSHTTTTTYYIVN